MPFKNILVIINPEKDEQVALDKAIRISEALGTGITALIRQKHAIPELLATLDQKLSVAAYRGIKVAIEISEERDWFRSIMRTLHNNSFDLMVKEPHASSVTNHVFLPADWKLLRNSPVPVLLVRTDNKWHQRPVLLCVNADSTDREHQGLNTRIIQTGHFLADVGDTKLHLVSAYPSQMQDAGTEAQVPDLLRAQYQAGCQRLLGEKPSHEARIHVDQGPPELLIPEVARHIDAQLVVLGTVARSGLQGVLLGNTAEQVLGRLNTDVLVLPPKE